MQPNQPIRTEAGDVVGGYELVRRLGRGGMAEVWVARKALGSKGSKFVAIKLIADHYIGDERYTRMFRAEAELAAILSHANIVQVFDEGEDNGRSYLVMEWVDGLNLLKLGAVLALLDDEERRCRVTAYIIGQLLHALHYAHSITSADGHPLGVVHRDVSPQNVLVSNHGEVKLTDFGVAYYNVEQSSGIHVKGKVRYMSPEQISGKTRSATVDLYAVGALLHELLDGKKFRGEYDDGQDLFTAVINGEVPPLSRAIPPELDELRLGLLAPDPAERIQTAEDALAWLQRYPNYGDARGELTKLCSSLTGVVRPRAGPGQSSSHAMADKRAGLAKPRVNREASRPVKPIVPPPPPGGMAATPALITGKTEFIAPELLRPGKKQAGGGMAARPPAPPATENLGHVVARASAAAVAIEPSSQPVAAPAIAYPAVAPAPPVVTAVPVPPPVAPTEFFSASEISVPGATEAIDVSAFAEPVSSSVTDVPPMAALREGTDPSRELEPQSLPPEATDPSRELRPHTVPPSPARVAAVSRRAAIAMLVVGLLLVAVTSVVVTWWLFKRNRGEAPLVATTEDAAISASTPVEVPTEPAPSPSKANAAPEAPPEPLVAPPSGVPEQGQGSGNEGAAEPVPSEPDATRGEASGSTSDDAPEPTEIHPSGDRDPERPRARSASPAAPPRPKATVVVTALPSIADGAQVRIVGGPTFTISKGATITKKLTAGKKSVEWRTDPGASWKPGPAVVLESGKVTTIKLTFTGPRVLAN